MRGGRGQPTYVRELNEVCELFEFERRALFWLECVEIQSHSLHKIHNAL